MANHPENFTPDQPDLFQAVVRSESILTAANAPDLDCELEFLAAVKSALKLARRHGLGRDRIVERMNMCLPEEQHITLRQLNAWCAESKEHHPFPAHYLPALCWACTGIAAPLAVLADALGLALVDETDQLATELGRLLGLEGELKKRKRLLQTKLWR